MNTRAKSAPGAALLPLLGAAVVVACSYDFDRFVDPHGALPGSGGAKAATAGSPAAESAGTASGGHGGSGGSAAGEQGEGGSFGEAGVAGSEAGRASGGGSAGQGSGGDTNGGKESGAGQGGKSGGSGEGGTANAGKASAGKGGTSPSGGKGGGTSGTGGAGGSSGKPSAGASGTGGASCTGSGATSHDGHCYFLVGDDTPLDWSSAKSACEAHSSTTHLVTIGSADEQAMLVSSFFPSTSDTWIGLSLDDVTKDPSSLCKVDPSQCPFKWVTGEKLGYTDWTMRSGSDSEPNYTGACVRLQAADQTWADTSCSSKNRAICEDDG
ncbi:MAG TPA: C-type lectin domain-containing protein [Polyangiaceae bacterium]|nr:C-type lectin domain-containing protein [Polyangiaceae bacterium]